MLQNFKISIYTDDEMQYFKVSIFIYFYTGQDRTTIASDTMLSTKISEDRSRGIPLYYII